MKPPPLLVLLNSNAGRRTWFSFNVAAFKLRFNLRLPQTIPSSNSAPSHPVGSPFSPSFICGFCGWPVPPLRPPSRAPSTLMHSALTPPCRRLGVAFPLSSFANYLSLVLCHIRLPPRTHPVQRKSSASLGRQPLALKRTSSSLIPSLKSSLPN